MEDSYDHPSWAMLPRDILVLIAERLSPTADFLSFSGVCRSWRSASGKENYPPSRQAPLLMLPEDDRINDTRGFYNPSDGSIRRVKLPEARGTLCTGSSSGWLVMVTKELGIQILNPMSHKRMELPPLTTFHTYGQNWTSPRENRYNYLRKVFLSPENRVAVAIYDFNRRLAFARPGTSRGWTPITCPFYPFYDVIYYKGEFHAVGHLGFVVACDVRRQPCNRRVRVVAPPVRCSIEYYCAKKYLVECCGDLLQVLQWNQVIHGEIPERFQICKWNQSRKEWQVVNSLDGRSIFIGHNSSFSVSSDSPGCRPNCIYFTHYDIEKNKDDRWWHDMGVYSLEDRSILPHYTGCCLPYSSPPIWVQPRLWR